MSSCRGTYGTWVVLTDDGSGGEVVCDDTRFTSLDGQNHLKNRSEVGVMFNTRQDRCEKIQLE